MLRVVVYLQSRHWFIHAMCICCWTTWIRITVMRLACSPITPWTYGMSFAPRALKKFSPDGTQWKPTRRPWKWSLLLSRRAFFSKPRGWQKETAKLLASLSTSCTAIAGRFTAALPAKQQPDRSMKPTLRLHRRIWSLSRLWSWQGGIWKSWG